MSIERNLQSFFKNSKVKYSIQARKLMVKEKEMNDPKEISNNIKVFCETFLKQNSSKTNV